jgi:hypothetical protein
VWQVPGYSTEQYSVRVGEWNREVVKRLALTQQSATAELKKALDTACSTLKLRVSIVKDTAVFLNSIGNRCLNASEYDNHSTPSRDSNFRAELDDLKALYQTLANEGARIDSEVNTQAKEVLGITEQSRNGFCQVEIKPGSRLTLSQVYARIKQGLLSSNPNDPIEYRWGEYSGLSAHARSCTQY